MEFTEALQQIRDFCTAGAEEGYSPEDLERCPVTLPECLRELYLTLGRSKLCRGHDQLIAPDRLASEEGKVEFAIENQSVVSWAFDAVDSAETDPGVYQKGLSVSGAEWQQMDCETLSAFLPEWLFWCAAQGAAPFGGVGEEPDGDVFDALPLIWSGPQFEVRGRDGALCMECGFLYVFGRDEEAVGALAKELDLEWFDMS